MGVPAALGVSASGRSPYWPEEDRQANGVIQGTLAAVRASKPFPFWGPMNLWLWASFATSLTTTDGSLTGVVGATGALAAGVSINSALVPKGTTMSALGGSNATLVLPIYTYWAKTKAGIAKITDLESTQWLLGATVSGRGIPAGTTVLSIDTPAVLPSTFKPNGVKGTVTISNAITDSPNENIKSPFEFAIAATAIVAGVDAAAVFTGAPILWNATVQLERSFDGGGTFLPCNIGGSGALAQWAGDGSTTGGPVSLSFGEPERQILYRLNALAYTGIANTTLNYRISETGQAATTVAVPTLS